jgi:diguanylate cyclase (GGDEF)-like protein
MNFPHITYDSLILRTIVNLFTTGAMMLFIWNADRPGPGLTEIALGDILIGLGLAIAGLRNIVPSESVIPLSHFAVFAGALLMLNGVRLFRGFGALPGWLNAAASVTYAAPLLYLTFVHDDMPARVMLSSAALGVMAVLMVVALLTDTPREDFRLYLFSATLMSFHALSLGLRVVWAFTHRENGIYVTGSPADYTAFITLNFMVTGCCVAIATASSRKLYHSTRKLALHDPLTKLPNRRMFEDRMSELCKLETQTNTALIYIDVDDFKVINETFGHSGGDQVLKVIGERLMAGVAEMGLTVRLGGDEFVILLENVAARSAAFLVMDKAIRSIQTAMTVGDHCVRLKVSSGLALYPEDVKCLSDLTDVADQRMYRAKRLQRRFGPYAGSIAESRLNASPLNASPKSLA